MLMQIKFQEKKQKKILILFLCIGMALLVLFEFISDFLVFIFFLLSFCFLPSRGQWQWQRYHSLYGSAVSQSTSSYNIQYTFGAATVETFVWLFNETRVEGLPQRNVSFDRFFLPFRTFYKIAPVVEELDKVAHSVKDPLCADSTPLKNPLLCQPPTLHYRIVLSNMMQ